MRLTNIILSALLALHILSCEKKQSIDENKSQVVGTIENGIITISNKSISIFDIQFDDLESIEIIKSVRAVGNFDVPPDGKADISSLIQGRVVKINVIEGDKVKKGEILAKMESIELLEVQESYLKLYYEIPVLEENFRRQKQLYEEEISSKKKYLEAKSTLNLKTAQLRSIEEELYLLEVDIPMLQDGRIINYISIKSPINGSVEKSSAVLGHFVEPNELLFTIVNSEDLHLELAVFSKDANELKVDQPIIYNVPSFSDQSYIGEVFLLTNTLDENAKSLNVHGHIKDEDIANFMPGMLIEAEIVISSFPGYNIPEEGISTSNQQYFVFEKIESRENGGLNHFRPVEVDYHGVINGKAQFIPLDSIENKVVTKGAFHLMAILESS